jgi:plasmid stabilization system protein ParE
LNQPFRIEPEAADELEQAIHWYERRRPGLGREFLSAVDECLDVLAVWPDSGATFLELPNDLLVRRMPIRRFPYHVVYMRTGESIRILAFAHDRRRPGYWRSRT